MMATSTNAQLLAMCGPRNPYNGKLGVVEAGGFADLLVIDGDPLTNLALVADPEKEPEAHHEGRAHLQEHPHRLNAAASGPASGRHRPAARTSTRSSAARRDATPAPAGVHCSARWRRNARAPGTP